MGADDSVPGNGRLELVFANVLCCVEMLSECKSDLRELLVSLVLDPCATAVN